MPCLYVSYYLFFNKTITMPKTHFSPHTGLVKNHKKFLGIRFLACLKTTPV